MMSDELAGQGPISEPPPIRTCVSCGRSIDWRANVCPYCGHDFRAVAGPPPKTKTSKPVVGGVLVLIAGILIIGNGLLYLVMDISELQDVPGYTDISMQDLEEIMNVCGAIMIVFGLIAIMGGVFAVTRKHFGLALAGSVFALLGIGFVLGSVLGLVGLILIAISRSEFGREP